MYKVTVFILIFYQIYMNSNILDNYFPHLYSKLQGS